MTRYSFFMRSLSFYLSMTGLMVGHSILLNLYTTMLVFTSLIFFLLYRKELARWTRYFQVFCAVAFFAVTLFQVVNGIESFALIFYIFYFLLSLLPTFLLRADSERSFWFLFLFLGIINVISLVLGKSDNIYIVFFFSVFSGIFALYSASIFFSSVYLNFAHKSLKVGSISSILIAMPLGLVTSLIIFFLFPRLHGYSNRFGWGPSFKQIGYSGTINLGDSGRLISSDQVMMYVQSKEIEWLKKESQSLLLRGNSLEVFNGYSWQKNREIPPNGSNVANGRSIFSDSRIVTIHRVSGGHSSLFYPGKFLGLWFLNPGISEDYNKTTGDLTLLNNFDERLTYSVLFEENKWSHLDNKIKLKDIGNYSSNKEMKYWLQVPDAIRNSSWYRGFLKQLSIYDSDNIGVVLSKMSGFFAQNFEVSTEISLDGGDAFRSFLLEYKKGHCEYFASAATIVLRSFGVPARIVLGYKGGVYNALIDVLEVRNSDAHAWVELWLPNTGWIAYDPTPSTFSDESLKAYLLLYVNAAEYILKRYVSGYDSETQRDMIDSLKTAFSLREESVKSGVSLVKKSFVPGILIIFLLSFFVILFYFSQRKSSSYSVPFFYEPIYKYFLKKGFDRFDAETFRSYHARLKKAGFDPNNLDILTDMIELHLYSRNQVPNISKEIRKIKKEIVSQYTKKSVI
jgi:hypothetical protein